MHSDGEIIPLEQITKQFIGLCLCDPLITVCLYNTSFFYRTSKLGQSFHGAPCTAQLWKQDHFE